MKKTLALILALMMCLMLFACNSSGGSSAPVESSKPEGTDSTPAEDVEIKISYWGSTIEDEVIKSISSKFAEANGITVTTLYIPNADYSTKMASFIASDETPDIAYIFSSDIYKWADQGLFANVYDLLEADPDYSYEDFIPAAFFEWEPGKSAGRRIATEVINLYYNKDIFDECGVDYLPSNWEDALTFDEFLEVCQKLTIDGNGKNALDADFDANNIVQYGFNVAKDYDGWGSWVHNNGGTMFSDDGLSFTLTDSKSIEAIQYLADMINVHHVAPDATTAATQNNNGAAQSLMSGAVAIFQDGQWACLDFSGMDFNWDGL